MYDGVSKMTNTIITLGRTGQDRDEHSPVYLVGQGRTETSTHLECVLYIRMTSTHQQGCQGQRAIVQLKIARSADEGRFSSLVRSERRWNN